MKKFPLYRFLLFSVSALADTFFTMEFQPVSYWDGEFSAARDFNPLVTLALNFSPWMAIPGFMGWVIFIGVLVKFLPAKIHNPMMTLLTISHLVFATGWIIRS